MSARVPSADIAAIHALEANHFRLIETYLTFAAAPNAGEENRKPDDRVRLANPADVSAVSKLAFEAFRYNRYMVDPLLPEEQARHSRLVWVENAFKGRAEAIYVAEADGAIAGFLILRTVGGEGNDKAGLIDLIAVHPGCAGHGIGKSLVAKALEHYKGKAGLVKVGTQSVNIAAVNLYHTMGFRFQEAENTLHWHA